MTEQIIEKSVKDSIEQSIQGRLLEDYANHTLTVRFLSSDSNCNILPSPWWSQQREYELGYFFQANGNDILQSAFSSFIDKFKAMNYTITGPEMLAKQCMEMMVEANFGKGLSELLGQTTNTYLISDKGSFWEIIGTGDPKETPKEITGFAYLDNQYCILTNNVEYPVIYTKTKDNKPRWLHRSRVYHFVSMPSPNSQMNNTGFCALSRIIQASSIMLKLAKYKDEKLSDLPEAGLLLFNNVLPTKWDDRVAEYETIRDQKGQEYWKNLITLFGLDPTQPATANLISFANLPDAFNELQQTEIYVNLVALSLGISPNELWSLSTGTTWNPTATEVTLQHQQAKNKGVGDLISHYERALNWNILPPSCRFQFDYIDDAEDLQATNINAQKIMAIMNMWRPPTGDQIANGVEIPVPVEVIRQLLAEQVSWFNRQWLQSDINSDVTLTEYDAIKHFGPIITIDQDFRVKRFPDKLVQQQRRATKMVIETLEEKYKKGEITTDDLVEFALTDLIDKEILLK